MPSGFRITRRTAASISFGMGSFVLMADAMVVVIRSDGGGNLFELGFPTVLGWIGIALWAVGLIILLWHMLAREEEGSERPVRPVFLRGKKAFKCRSCGVVIDAGRVGYHERMKCRCGVRYDVYQDPAGNK